MGAFDNYQSPSGGAFGNYQPPSGVAPASAGSTQDLGTTALWNKPANVSWSDYLLAHLAKQTQGADQAAQDYSRTAVDAATFGLGDRLQSALTGNSLADERAKTAAASGRLGAMAPIVSGAMYAMGPGELGAASKIGEAIAPATGKWLGGVLGSAAEGATAGAAGAAGHDEVIGQGALVGGALGAAGGVPGGVVGRGGALSAPISSDDLKAAAQSEYAPLSQILFDAKGEIHPELDAAKNAIDQIDRTGQQWKLAKSTRAEFDNLQNSVQLSGEDIQKAQARLDKVASNPNATDQDKWMAPRISDALENVMQNGLPQTGVPAGVQPSGYAATVRDAGDVLAGQAKDVGRVQTFLDKAKVAGGPDVSSQAKQYLLSDEGQRFAPAGSPQFKAYNDLAKAPGGPDVGVAPSIWDIRHVARPVIDPLIGAAFGAGAGAFGGHEDMASIGEGALAGAALGYGLHKGVPAFQAKFFQQPAQQRALASALSTLSSGNYQAPIMPTTPLRDALRTVIFGQGARGVY